LCPPKVHGVANGQISLGKLQNIFLRDKRFDGINKVSHGNNFGTTGIVFGSIGLLFAFNWLKQFFILPKEKRHWVFSHLQGFGAAYIAATTAFMVVNIKFLPDLLVWLSPTVVGATIITLVTISYKKKFLRNQKIKYITD
jgi:hypothetical protein